MKYCFIIDFDNIKKYRFDKFVKLKVTIGRTKNNIGL